MHQRVMIFRCLSCLSSNLTNPLNFEIRLGLLHPKRNGTHSVQVDMVTDTEAFNANLLQMVFQENAILDNFGGPDIFSAADVVKKAIVMFSFHNHDRQVFAVQVDLNHV